MGQFGKFLRELREDRKMTLRDVEEKIHISNAYLSQVESGQRSIPTMRILSKLAECYGCKVETLTNAAEAELRHSKSTLDEPPAPGAEFICRGYENLNEGNKQALKKFLQHLQREEKEKK
ncbi:MAG: helix-turn-helix transcriptional regulator [Nitrospirae bacterium]|nr:helix-turn-helix transcriptional regulator [Nitrospirota bacterium]